MPLRSGSQHQASSPTAMPFSVQHIRTVACYTKKAPNAWQQTCRLIKDNPDGFSSLVCRLETSTFNVLPIPAALCEHCPCIPRLHA